MRILFIADVVGSDGRRAVAAHVPRLREEGADVVIANGENAAGGLGLTPKLARELMRSGVDVITSGNHLFRRPEIVAYLETEERILRPQNFRPRAPGKGHLVFKTASGADLGILNLVGQLYMDPADDPGLAADAILDGALASVSTRLLDFHAEATGEKQGMFQYLDGRVSAIIGTHTHVQTADEKVSEKGTAYITDAGMTGSTRSVIGMDPTPVLQGIRTGLPQRYQSAKGNAELQGVLIDVEESGRATSIERLRLPVPEKEDE